MCNKEELCQFLPYPADDLVFRLHVLVKSYRYEGYTFKFNMIHNLMATVNIRNTLHLSLAPSRHNDSTISCSRYKQTFAKAMNVSTFPLPAI